MQFPHRTWLSCAGFGEWGTSWFLATKWKVLSEQAKAEEDFLALILVKQGQDESATLVKLFKTVDELEDHISELARESVREL